MPGSPHFIKLIDEIRELHIKKNTDYSIDSNPFFNFEYAAEWAGVSVKQVFRVLEGIKIARLKSLESQGRAPLNESVLDTQLDLSVYRLMEIAYEQMQCDRFEIDVQDIAKNPDPRD